MKGLAAQADRYIAMDLVDPRVDFVRLAGSLGVPAERVERVADVRPALARALAAPGPTLLDVELDRSFKVLGGQEPPAYFIGYTITDTQRAEVSGSNGALLSSSEARNRWRGPIHASRCADRHHLH